MVLTTFKPMRPTGPEAKQGMTSIRKPSCGKLSDHVLTERMPYDGERVRFEHPVEMHHNWTILNKQRTRTIRAGKKYTITISKL
jgi:hypothetical protein